MCNEQRPTQPTEDLIEIEVGPVEPAEEIPVQDQIKQWFAEHHISGTPLPTSPKEPSASVAKKMKPQKSLLDCGPNSAEFVMKYFETEIPDLANLDNANDMDLFKILEQAGFQVKKLHGHQITKVLDSLSNPNALVITNRSRPETTYGHWEVWVTPGKRIIDIDGDDFEEEGIYYYEPLKGEIFFRDTSHVTPQRATPFLLITKG